MRLVRGAAGAVLWILAAVLGLVALLLCVTVLLLPLGIPLLGVSRRLFTQGLRLMVPRAVAQVAKVATSAVGVSVRTSPTLPALRGCRPGVGRCGPRRPAGS